MLDRRNFLVTGARLAAPTAVSSNSSGFKSRSATSSQLSTLASPAKRPCASARLMARSMSAPSSAT